MIARFPLGRHVVGVALLAVLALAGPQASGQRGSSLAIRDSFRIGSGGVLCTAQLRPLDANAPGMFDRGYAIVCRDAAAAVGQLHAVRGAMPAGLAEGLDCGAAAPAAVAGLAGATVADCARRSDQLPYRLYTYSQGGTLYVAQGLRGYDSAVVLGLRTLVADRPVEGSVDVAITEAGDPAAFARVQAGQLDAESARIEGYQRNNAGSFAEAAQFFDTLIQGSAARPRDVRTVEYLLNQGLQQSDLGNAPGAAMAFDQAAARGATRDLVLSRQLRNYRAIHQLSLHDPASALAILDAPVVSAAEARDDRIAGGSISEELSRRINRASGGIERIGGDEATLLPIERAQVLDGQAELLRGSARRLMGQPNDALVLFANADRQLGTIREGRVVSVAFLRAEILGESALAHEALGDFAAADRDLRAAVAVDTLNYPDSAALLMAKARLAAFLVRRGQDAQAMALYGEVVAGVPDTPGALAGVRSLLNPYYTLLARRAPGDSAAVDAMFAANQTLVRPGLAQTQAVLARELSAGDDDAARLFRASVTSSREVARVNGEIAQLSLAEPDPESEEGRALDLALQQLATLQQEQVALQAQLAAYPRYRVLDPSVLSLADLQKVLRPGEAYYELRIVDDDVYAILLTPDTRRAFQLRVSAADLATTVAQLRDSIVVTERGVAVTRPYDLRLARALYELQFGPVDDVMRGVKHLIYEPDGPLLQLPPNLLVTDDASVARYDARQRAADADPFDFTGVAWLGRGRDISTSVSPRAFVDVRAASASRASRAYLGLGQNARPLSIASFLAATAPPQSSDPCAWPIAAWGNPIRAGELYAARDLLGASQSNVLTGSAFTDDAIKARDDLADYRVLHFATHGLVTSPRAACSPQPALLTSFGAPDTSDGLLSFREIYDLRIDADIVILSACDTAGMASVAATRAAGVATGGDFALDGLVRAFVGAGARTVVASHWPVPDDFDATRRLVLGIFQGDAGTPVASALRRAETALMDDPATSHPYYWAAFAVVGDGERPIARGQ